MKIELSIIIITWNEKATLERCLKSFYNEFNFKTGEIIVIDNGSSDSTDSLFKENYQNCRYLKLPKNIGVGPARNRGIMLSKGDFLMTLDNDTIIHNCDFLPAIKNHYLKNPETGILGFKLLNTDGTLQHSCRRFPGWLQPLSARIRGLTKFNFFKKIQDRHLMVDTDFSASTYPMAVDYVLGANQIFTRETASQLYGYDESIFFGPEDFDFCFRAMKNISKINYYSNSIEITHDYQRRTRKFSIILLNHIISFYRTLLKNKIFHL